MNRKIHLTERTSKTYKAGVLCGGVVMTVGVVVLLWAEGGMRGDEIKIVARLVAPFVALAGLVVLGVSLLLGWWEHG